MKSFLLVLVGLIIGGAATVVLAPALLGVGAGVGIATGMKAGACLTVEAAKERGFITAEQVDEVLRAAVKQIASSAPDGSAAALTDADAECAKVVSDLKKAAKN
jgi:hypothetical protein